MVWNSICNIPTAPSPLHLPDTPSLRGSGNMTTMAITQLKQQVIHCHFRMLLHTNMYMHINILRTSLCSLSLWSSGGRTWRGRREISTTVQMYIPPNCYSHYMAWGCMCQLHAILDLGSRNSEAVQSWLVCMNKDLKHLVAIISVHNDWAMSSYSSHWESPCCHGNGYKCENPQPQHEVGSCSCLKVCDSLVKMVGNVEFKLAVKNILWEYWRVIFEITDHFL